MPATGYLCSTTSFWVLAPLPVAQTLIYSKCQSAPGACPLVNSATASPVLRTSANNFVSAAIKSPNRVFSSGEKNISKGEVFWNLVLYLIGVVLVNSGIENWLRHPDGKLTHRKEGSASGIVPCPPFLAPRLVFRLPAHYCVRGQCRYNSTDKRAKKTIPEHPVTLATAQVSRSAFRPHVRSPGSTKEMLILRASSQCPTLGRVCVADVSSRCQNRTIHLPVEDSNR